MRRWLSLVAGSGAGERVDYIAADQVEECWQLLRQSMRSVSFEYLAHLPGYSAWLRDHDWAGAYRRHRRNLQLIGLSDAGRRWVLKNPSHERFTAERARHDPARFYDVGYEEFTADPFGAVEAAYGYFGLPLSGAAADAMRSLTGARPGQGHRYTLADFGLTGAKVDERFAAIPGYEPSKRQVKRHRAAIMRT